MSDTQVVELTINEVNLPPVIQPIGDLVVYPGQVVVSTFSVSDPDIPPQVLTYVMGGLPSNAVFNSSNGSLVWTSRAEHVGMHNLVLSVDDGGAPAQTDSNSFSVSVIDLPALSNIVHIVESETFCLEAAVLTGMHYRVWYTADLVEDDWSPLPVVEATNSQLTVDHDVATQNVSRLFYKLEVLP